MIGAFQALLGDSGSQSDRDLDFVSGGTQNLSPEVEELRPLFEKYAEIHGIPDHVDLLMAKTMQESGGRLPDVMQASESQGLPVNTIDNQEESIDVGTEYFARVLEEANGDEKLALQSYNFGAGFIDYANEHNNGEYSKELAIEFSIEQYQRVRHTGNYSCIRPESAETGACYGDIGYVDAVLSYMQPTLEEGDFDEVIEVGTQWIGNSEYVFGGGRTRSDQEQGIFDCSSFVHWSFEQVGIELGNFTGVTTDTLKHKGEAVPLEDIQQGDLVFFDTYKIDGHVGIYIGDGKYIGAQSSTGVAIESIEEGYWGDVFNGRVRRI
ncbi:transglycosylase SLT domain-containing protein [Bacillus luteus]|uniref:Transglycosylase SLT domain-containing protein n=2 Tax=Alkalicoccus luteus TaxID=1237094 RepID=A0A969PTS1_9BACI|nr:transglycosylase SLT domain-containing protein [Alkalicoccus luteus]